MGCAGGWEENTGKKKRRRLSDFVEFGSLVVRLRGGLQDGFSFLFVRRSWTIKTKAIMKRKVREYELNRTGCSHM